MDRSFTPNEIRKHQQNLKNKKAIGPDAVYAEYIKYGADKLFSVYRTSLIEQLRLEVIQMISDLEL